MPIACLVRTLAEQCRVLPAKIWYSRGFSFRMPVARKFTGSAVLRIDADGSKFRLWLCNSMSNVHQPRRSLISLWIRCSVRVVAACRKRFRGGERVCHGIASPFKIPRPTKVCAPIDFAAMEFLSYTLLRPNFELPALHPVTIGSIYRIDT